ncbi:hypothetical protein KSP39_PZI018732 [Platanthera zijinensis]|uniref:Uncharacterized protein n=1 Tax=Platanthera zijinensis TaxID=2320716 RepID=A0AAP0B4X2_9ASPA
MKGLLNGTYVSDGLLVQIHRAGVKFCLPTTAAHVKGFPFSLPFCTFRCPNNSISSGAVGHNAIIVATSTPCFLFVLGVRSSTSYQRELGEMQRLRLQQEVSCIFMPEQEINFKELLLDGDIVKKDNQETPCNGDALHLTFIIGTHVPSVEALSLLHSQGFRFLAMGEITLDNALTNWVLVPLGDSPDAVVVVLSERPWLLHVSRHRIAYTSSSFQPATHTTCVSSFNCPNGILFLADNKLHWVGCDLGNMTAETVKHFKH